jgi:hypothetical protein
MQDDEPATPRPRKRSKSASRSASQSQKIRRMSAGQGVSELAAWMRKMTDGMKSRWV